MPHRIESAFAVLHSILTMLFAAAVPIVDTAGTSVFHVMAFYVIGGCFGALAQVILFPSRNGSASQWNGAKFAANWCASLFVAPGVIYLFAWPENPRVILLVSGSCAVGAVYLVRFIRRIIASKTEEGDE